MDNRLKSIRHADDFVLEIEWQDGRVQQADLSGLVAGSRHFRCFLDDPKAFTEVEAVNWGHGVGWKNGLDYAAENLARIADEQEQDASDGSAELRDFQQRFGLTIEQTGRVLGYRKSQIKNFRSGLSPVPHAVRIAIRAMKTDPAVFYAHNQNAPKHAGPVDIR